MFLGLASISLAIATFLKNQKADIKNNVKKIKKLLDAVKLANEDSKYIRKEGIDSLLKPNEKFEKTTKELDRVVNHLINVCMLFFLGLVESLTLDLLINSSNQLNPLVVIELVVGCGLMIFGLINLMRGVFGLRSEVQL